MPARTLVVVALCVVVTACASAPRAQSFATLANHLRPGQAVTVTDVSGTTVDGRLEGMTPTTLTVLVGGERREIADDRVARVQRRKREVARGALVLIPSPWARTRKHFTGPGAVFARRRARYRAPPRCGARIGRPGIGAPTNTRWPYISTLSSSAPPRTTGTPLTTTCRMPSE